MFPTQFTGASFTWERKEFSKIVQRIFTANSNKSLPNIEFEDIDSEIGTLNKSTSQLYKRKKGILFEKNNILFGKLRPYLKKWFLADFSGIAVGDFWVLKPSDNQARFVYYLIQTSSFYNVSNITSGTKMPRSDWKLVSKTKFYIPMKLSEKHKLGMILYLIDKLINLHENYLQLLYNFRSFLLQKMFSINDTFPNLRFKQFNDKWKDKKLGEVADIVSGGTPDTTKHNYWNGSINWYTPAEVGNKIFVSDSQRKITNIGLENSSAKILPVVLPVGTVLFTSRAGIGKTAILKEKGSTNQGFQSIVPKQRFLDSYFIFSMSNILKKYGESHGAGSTFLEISGKELAKAKISLPSITEQKNISKVLFKLDTIITLQKQKIDNLKKLKQFLLQNMFI